MIGKRKNNAKLTPLVARKLEGGGMRPIWILLLALIVGLPGCDLGKKEKEVAASSYNTNAEAAKKCRTQLKGRERVPIVGTGGKLFLDVSRLPTWEIDRGLGPHDECGAATLGWGDEIFYWTGKEIIPKSVWLARGHSLVERPGPQDWLALGGLVGFGFPKSCKGNPVGCEALKDRGGRERYRVIQLKKYALDAHVFLDTNLKHVGLYLRGWPKENGNPRGLDCGTTPTLNGLSDKEIEDFDFVGRPGAVCQLDFPQFKFHAGAARFHFMPGEAEHAVPALRAIHQYLNESIIEE